MKKNYKHTPVTIEVENGQWKVCYAWKQLLITNNEFFAKAVATTVITVCKFRQKFLEKK